MTQKPITSLFRSRRRLIATVCLASIVIMIVGVGVFGSSAVYAAEVKEGWFDKIVSGLSTFLLQYFTLPLIILQKILQFANAIIAWLLFYLATYNNFIYNPIVEVGWVAVRDLANLGFITILIWIAFAMMIPGLGGGLDYKKALPKLLLMAVLINFSRMITGILIDISQVVVLTFLKPFRDDGPGILLGGTGYFDTGTEAAYEKLKAASATQGIGGVISMFVDLMIQRVVDTIFLAMTAVIFCIMMVMFLGRLIALWILTIFSPFAFILSVVPQTQKYAKEWWGQLGKNLTAAPILAFFLWLTFIVAIQGGEAGKTISEIPAVLTTENLKKAVDACGSDEACKRRVEEEQDRAVAMQNKVASLGEGARGTIASITKLIITIALLMEGIKRAVESGAAGASIAKKIPAGAKKMASRFVAGGGVAKVLRGVGKIPGFGKTFGALGKEGGVIDRYSRLASPELAKKAWEKYQKGQDEVFDTRKAKGTVSLGQDLLDRRLGASPRGVARGVGRVLEGAGAVRGGYKQWKLREDLKSTDQATREAAELKVKQAREGWVGRKGADMARRFGAGVSDVTGGALDATESNEEGKVLKAALIEDVKEKKEKIDKSGDSQMDVAKNSLVAEKSADLYGGLAVLEENGGHGELAKQFNQSGSIEAERLAKKKSGLSDEEWKARSDNERNELVKAEIQIEAAQRAQKNKGDDWNTMSKEEKENAINAEKANAFKIEGVGTADGMFDASVDTYLLALAKSLQMGMSEIEIKQSMKAHSDSLAKQGVNVSGAGWANVATGALAHTYQGSDDKNEQVAFLQQLANLEGLADENTYVNELGAGKLTKGEDIRERGFGRAMIASNIDNNKREAAKRYKTEEKMSRTASASQEMLLDKEGKVTDTRTISGKMALKNASWQDVQRAAKAQGQSDVSRTIGIDPNQPRGMGKGIKIEPEIFFEAYKEKPEMAVARLEASLKGTSKKEGRELLVHLDNEAKNYGVKTPVEFGALRERLRTKKEQRAEEEGDDKPKGKGKDGDKGGAAGGTAGKPSGGGTGTGTGGGGVAGTTGSGAGTTGGGDGGTTTSPANTIPEGTAVQDDKHGRTFTRKNDKWVNAETGKELPESEFSKKLDEKARESTATASTEAGGAGKGGQKVEKVEAPTIDVAPFAKALEDAGGKFESLAEKLNRVAEGINTSNTAVGTQMKAVSDSIESNNSKLAQLIKIMTEKKTTPPTQDKGKNL